MTKEEMTNEWNSLVDKYNYTFDKKEKKLLLKRIKKLRKELDNLILAEKEKNNNDE